MTTLALVNLGTPVYGATKYGEFLVPRNGGGWMYGEQLYVYPNHNPTEWIVTHLETGDYTRQVDNIYTPNTRGQYASTNYNTSNQLRAPNGRVFIPAQNNYVWYYDPNTELVQLLPKIPSIGITNSDSLVYTMVFNHDGSNLYGGTLGNNLASPIFHPEVFVLDPVTLAVNVITRVGSAVRTQPTYAYYLWADGNYLYVCVGEGTWEVVAVNLTTGATTVLGSSSTNAFASFEMKPEGLTAKVFTNHGRSGQTVDQFWCVDGVRYTYTAGYNPATLPFTPRDVTQYSNPVSLPPQIDNTFGAQGVQWRANGSTGNWTLVPFSIQYGDGINIESLRTLPDNSLIGNAENYTGWFRYYPTTGVTTYFGPFQGISGEPKARLVVGGYLYASGYPNGPLWKYDRNAAWDTAGGTNPVLLGYYSDGTILSAIKRSTHMAYSETHNRLYVAGLLQRSGSGGGIGYYDFGTHTFGGTHTNLGFYQAHLGLAVFDEHDRVVFSGQIGPDPDNPGSPPPASASLVLYDHNLTEIERQTPIIGAQETGLLYRTDEPNVVIGVASAGYAYRWDIVSKTLLKSVDLTVYGTVVSGTQTQLDNKNILVVIGSTLYTINPLTLEISSNGDFPSSSIASGVVAMRQSGRDLYITSGPTLYALYGTAATARIDPDIMRPTATAGAAEAQDAFNATVIQVLNSQALSLNVVSGDDVAATIDQEILTPSSETGRAEQQRQFNETLIATINAHADEIDALAHSSTAARINPDILSPSSPTGVAIAQPAFNDALIAAINHHADSIDAL
jgi:hypothetical protein